MGNQNKYKSGSIFDMQFITSSISTTLVLLLLGLVVFFVLTAHNLSVYVRENISFSVLISDDMKEADILKLQKKLEHLELEQKLLVQLQVQKLVLAEVLPHIVLLLVQQLEPHG